MGSKTRIIHIGLWKFKPNAPQHLIDELDRRIGAFKDEIPGVLDSFGGPLKAFPHSKKIIETYGAGPDDSLEAKGYNHVLYTVFKTEQDRINYEDAQGHFNLGDYLNSLLENGIDSMLTFNFITS